MRKNLLIMAICLVAFVFNGRAQDLTEGLVFYLPMNDGEAINMVVDSENEGELIGDPIPEVGFNDVADGAMLFGAGAYIDFVADDIEDLPIEGQERTIAAWFNTEMATGEGELVSFGSQEKGAHQHLNFHYGAAEPFFRAGYWYKDYDCVTPFNDGAWHHVAITANQDDDEFLMYLDGELQEDYILSGEAATLTMNTTAGGILRIAARNGETFSSDYQGMLDEVRIYNIALEEDDIAALFAFDPDAEPEPSANAIFNTNTLKVYPTLANDFINVKSDLDFSKIEIINIAGKVVSVNEGAKQISLENVAQGVYFVKGYTQEQSYTAKFVKQ